MKRLTALIAVLCLTGAVAGCQTGLGGPKPQGPDAETVTENAVTGDAIETTALDEAPAAVADKSVAEAGPAAAQGAAPEPVAEAAPQPAPQPDPEDVVPVTPKSERQLACEKKGGKWSGAPGSDLRTCVFNTRDAGKQCTRESQCEGVCLARSGTCSPIKPLLGCNEILQDNGARVTLCID